MRILVESIEPYIKRFEIFKNQTTDEHDNGAENFVFNQDIVFNKVSFKYSDQQVLKNINLKIAKNQITGIIGPSGSGKSTIIDLILKIYEPNNGQISLMVKIFQL